MKKRIKLNSNPNADDIHDDEQGGNESEEHEDDSIENIFDELFQY